MNPNSNIIRAKSIDYTGRGLTTEKMSVHWEHYISGVSTYTLFSTGATTDFPYSYGGISVPYKGSETSTYGNNVRETVILDFGRLIEINQGEVVTLRLQVNGQWWYSSSTSIITER